MSEDLGNVVRSQDGEIYQGSILEHILIQHLTAFYHVGDNNCILLEDADWNDALDMANQKGESVAFCIFCWQPQNSWGFMSVPKPKRVQIG